MANQEAPDRTRDRLAPPMLLYGLVRAVGRFTSSGLTEDALSGPDNTLDLDRQVLTAEWGAAVFEALNWSVVLDERLGHERGGRGLDHRSRRWWQLRADCRRCWPPPAVALA